MLNVILFTIHGHLYKLYIVDFYITTVLGSFRSLLTILSLLFLRKILDRKSRHFVRASFDSGNMNLEISCLFQVGVYFK